MVYIFRSCVYNYIKSKATHSFNWNWHCVCWRWRASKETESDNWTFLRFGYRILCFFFLGYMSSCSSSSVFGWFVYLHDLICAPQIEQWYMLRKAISASIITRNLIWLYSSNSLAKKRVNGLNGQVASCDSRSIVKSDEALTECTRHSAQCSRVLSNHKLLRRCNAMGMCHILSVAFWLDLTEKFFFLFYCYGETSIVCTFWPSPFKHCGHHTRSRGSFDDVEVKLWVAYGAMARHRPFIFDQTNGRWLIDVFGNTYHLLVVRRIKHTKPNYRNQICTAQTMTVTQLHLSNANFQYHVTSI